MWKCIVIGLLALGLNAVSRPSFAQDRPVFVFAAASLKEALDDVGKAFTARTGRKVIASYAASSALIKQIEQGAPADVFLSADTDWMDYGAQRKLVQNNSRVDLLGNSLVLVATADSRIDRVTLGKDTSLAEIAGQGRIVTADVRAVPAGKYAKEALGKLGMWTAVEKKLAMTENVRVALALVARGEATLGIVYATDAAVEPKVKVVGTFPAASHAPIVYPAALTATATPAAQAYVDFLRSAEAKTIFERYGFFFLVTPSS